MAGKRVLMAVLLVGSALCGTAQAGLPPVRFRAQRRGNLVHVHCGFSSTATERLANDPLYAMHMGGAVTARLMRVLGIPDSFTAKVGALGALLPLHARTATELHLDARAVRARHGNRGVSMNKTYTVDRGAIKAIFNILGAIGDRTMPFGEGANAIIGLVNRTINAAKAR